MDDPRGVVGEVDLAAELRHRLHRLLAEEERYLRSFEGSDDGGDDEMEVLFEAGSEDSKGVEDLDEAVLSARLREVMLERFEHEGEEVREVGLELGVESDCDRLDHVDDDDLETGVGRQRPEVADGGHDRSEVVSDVLLDHRDELSEVLEVVFLKSNRTCSHDAEEGG